MRVSILPAPGFHWRSVQPRAKTTVFAGGIAPARIRPALALANPNVCLQVLRYLGPNPLRLNGLKYRYVCRLVLILMNLGDGLFSVNENE
jgi:hypothetical protein